MEAVAAEKVMSYEPEQRRRFYILFDQIEAQPLGVTDLNQALVERAEPAICTAVGTVDGGYRATRTDALAARRTC